MNMRPERLTEMNVPGKKNKVTSVIIFMETVSCCVFLDISNIASVIFSIRSVESWARLAYILLLSTARLLDIS